MVVPASARSLKSLLTADIGDLMAQAHGVERCAWQRIGWIGGIVDVGRAWRS